MGEIFHHIASKISSLTGSPLGFIVALSAIIIWGLSGSFFDYSDTWQLVINTSTTIVTFLMVFLIQNTQNRDSKAINLKLDELLKGVKGARTGLVDIEDLSDEGLDKLEKQFSDMHNKYAANSQKTTGSDE